MQFVPVFGRAKVRTGVVTGQKCINRRKAEIFVYAAVGSARLRPSWAAQGHQTNRDHGGRRKFRWAHRFLRKISIPATGRYNDTASGLQAIVV